MLAEFLAGLKNPPKVFLSGSAIGYYGSRNDELLNEASSLGFGFLASVCKDWEHAAKPMSDAGSRLVYLRTGIVLSKNGGALAKMLTPFKLGLGGRIGSGKQFMSWISLDDEVAAILFCLGNKNITGPVNLVSPHPVRNEEFTKTLGNVLSRPTLFPLPAFAAKLLLGQQMAEELLLASQRVLPNQLQMSGFSFQYPLLHDALQHELRV
jgi:uncharacterized protein (TIGR01777 family)